MFDVVIRHVIIFHQVSEGDSGLYRVRAVNPLGEAECEAELYFDGCGGGDDMYLPPGWQDRKRLTWKDEDMRRKAFVGYKEPELTPEELAEMRKKSGGVPLNRIMEYLASLPNYVPSDKFRNMERLPFKPGVDERDYRPMRQGGKCSYPSVFQKGKFDHRGYKSDTAGRILPIWRNTKDPRSRDSSDLAWRPVHPDLFVPDLPQRCKSPDAPPVWETEEDIKKLIIFLNSMGCQLNSIVAEIKAEKLGSNFKQQGRKESNRTTNTAVTSESINDNISKQSKKKVDKFSYIRPNETDEAATTAHVQSVSSKSAKAIWEERLNANVVGAQTNAADFTSQFMSEMYQKKDNLSFPELDIVDRPALPPKTKIMNSPSRSIFSPTDSVENNAAASVKSVEFMPVKEKVKLIAAQQEELTKREEINSTTTASAGEKKNKGVRVLPPSPVTVRKMSVGEELVQYEEAVTRSTPVTQVMEKMATKPMSPVMHESFASNSYQSNTSTKSMQAKETPDYSTLDSGISQTMSSNYVTNTETTHKEAHYSSKTSFYQQSVSSVSGGISSGVGVPGWANNEPMMQTNIKQDQLSKSAAEKEIDFALDQLIAETESMVSEDNTMMRESSSSSAQRFQAFATTSQSNNSLANNNVKIEKGEETPAEECRRSFEEAELEAMALDSEASRSFSKQSSMVETCSTQSFQFSASKDMRSSYTNANTTSNPSRTTNNEAETRFNSRPLRSNSFVRTPDTFTATKPSASAPNTPMSQRRRLRINQSPRPLDDSDPTGNPKYRDSPTTPFQPGFYRPPPQDQERGHVFKLLRRSSSRSRAAENSSNANSPHNQQEEGGIRTSQASSRAYDGDESEVEERK